MGGRGQRVKGGAAGAVVASAASAAARRLEVSRERPPIDSRVTTNPTATNSTTTQYGSRPFADAVAPSGRGSGPSPLSSAASDTRSRGRPLLSEAPLDGSARGPGGQQ
jgi:hypothetical protein